MEDRAGSILKWLVLAVWAGLIVWKLLPWSHIAEMHDLAFWIVVVGAVEMTFGGIIHVFKLTKPWAGTTVIITGIFALLAGIWVWDYERRAATWDLHTEQIETLSEVLRQRGGHLRFEIGFYPINESDLAISYARQLYAEFVRRKWRVFWAWPNYVVPTKDTTGIWIVNCPHLTSLNTIELAKILKESGISFKIRGTEESLEERGCPVGMVIGFPPPPMER